jgi:hypothetical protein
MTPTAIGRSTPVPYTLFRVGMASGRRRAGRERRRNRSLAGRRERGCFFQTLLTTVRCARECDPVHIFFP